MLIYGILSLIACWFIQLLIYSFYLYDWLLVWIEMAGGVFQQLLRRKLQSHSPVSIRSSLYDNFILV